MRLQSTAAAAPRRRRSGLPGFLLLAGLLTLLSPIRIATPAAAQEGQVGVQDGPRVGPVYFGDFPEVEILVEPAGDPPPGAPFSGATLPPAEALSLLEDGEVTGTARKVRPFGETGRGIAFVVALDVSGTMAGEPLAEMRRALATLVAEAAPEDQVALVTFADEAVVASPFGAPRDSLLAAIDGLATRGRITELYQGLFKALDLFATPGLAERRRLIVISDGKDEGEAYQLEDVITRARQLQIPVDAIGLTRIDERYLSNLDRLARLSGGFYARARDAAELDGLVRQGLERLAATPVAAFELRNLAADGQPHRLGVRLRAGDRLLEGEVRVPFPLPPPPTAEPEPAIPEPAPEPAALPWWEDPRWLGLALGGAALLLLALVALIFRRRRHGEHRAEASAAEPWRPAGSVVEAEPVETGSRSTPGRPDGGFEIAATGNSPETLAEDPVPGPIPLLGPLPEQRGPGSRRKTQFRTELSPPGPGSPTAILVGKEGGVEGMRIPIETSPFWIGAEAGVHLHLPGDAYLSGHHACLQFHAGSLFVHDNGSTNGTHVNGERLGAVQRSLVPGDRIRFGRSTFVLTYP